jgi:hypothetical protein
MFEAAVSADKVESDIDIYVLIFPFPNSLFPTREQIVFKKEKSLSFFRIAPLSSFTLSLTVDILLSILDEVAG